MAENDDDDLDAFFDEVDEVEKDTLQKIDSIQTPEIAPARTQTDNDADDEQHRRQQLEAGDDVADAQQQQQRPSKKARTGEEEFNPTSSTAVDNGVVVGSRGVVVVAKKAVVVASSAAVQTPFASSSFVSSSSVISSSHIGGSIPNYQHHQQQQQPLTGSTMNTNNTISYYPSSSATTTSTNTHTIRNNPPPPPPPPPPPLPIQQPPLHQQHPPPTHKPTIRSAAGKKWTDPTLAAFPPNDFRLFVGNLSKDINDATLAQAFSSRYSSFAMARVCYNSSNGTSKEFGFVSLMDAKDCAKAIREMDQSWLGSRPIKVKRSEWKDRNLEVVKRNGRKVKRKKGKDRW